MNTALSIQSPTKLVVPDYRRRTMMTFPRNITVSLKESPSTQDESRNSSPDSKKSRYSLELSKIKDMMNTSVHLDSAKDQASMARMTQIMHRPSSVKVKRTQILKASNASVNSSFSNAFKENSDLDTTDKTLNKSFNLKRGTFSIKASRTNSPFNTPGRNSIDIGASQDSKILIPDNSYRTKSRLKRTKFLKLLSGLEAIRKQLFEEMRNSDYNAMFKTLTRIVQLGVDLNIIEIFLKGLNMIGEAYLIFKKIEDAFTIFNQLRTASKYAGVYSMKSRAFLKIAMCCKTMAYYEEAIKFLKKALQSAWEARKEGREIEIYDALGSVYFHLSDMKKAYYYHDRSFRGSFEPLTSPIREIYRMNIEISKKRFTKTDQVNKEYLEKLDLPFKIQLPEDTNPTEKPSYRQRLSNINFSSPYSDRLSDCESTDDKDDKKMQYKLSLLLRIRLILKGSEFENDLPSPRGGSSDIEDVQVPVTKTFRLFQAKKQNNHKIGGRKPDLPNVELKKSLQEQINDRLKSKLDSSVIHEELKNDIYKASLTSSIHQKLVLSHTGASRNAVNIAALCQTVYNKFESFRKKVVQNIKIT